MCDVFAVCVWFVLCVFGVCVCVRARGACVRVRVFGMFGVCVWCEVRMYLI